MLAALTDTYTLRQGITQKLKPKICLNGIYMADITKDLDIYPQKVLWIYITFQINILITFCVMTICLFHIKNKIDRNITHAYDLLWVNGIGNASGPYILYMLKAIRKYSNYDISPIIEQIKEKKEWLKEHYPDDYIYECKDFDIDKFFEEE